MKPLLRSENVFDEALLALLLKHLHQRKRGLCYRLLKHLRKWGRVHETNTRQEEANSKQHDDSTSKLVSAVDVLTSKLTSLHQDFDNMKQKNVKSRTFLYIIK